MASDSMASVEPVCEKAENCFGQSAAGVPNCWLAVENQSGTNGRKADAQVVQLELFDSGKADLSTKNGSDLRLSEAHSMQVAEEPRLPASEELHRKLAEVGRDDLDAELSKIDRLENAAREAFGKSNGDDSSFRFLTEATEKLGLFLEKAAQALPDDAGDLEACAEKELRTALQNAHQQFGAGTPEAMSYAEALQSLLESMGTSDQQEEIARLGFEAKRGGLMKEVVDDIEKTPNASYQSMSAALAQEVRQSLISIHIAGGDAALKSFVNDVNRRLDSEVLVAPIGQDGPFHHGAIILTPEGASSYNGSFNLFPKAKN